jgi:FlaA1/EpsC-like NDP-sugar epimerase
MRDCKFKKSDFYMNSIIKSYLPNEESVFYEVKKSKFLILGAAGTIGQAVTKEIFKRNPLKLHAVDISENNLVELVRDLRSEHGYIDGDFQTFSLDIGSSIYDAFIEADGNYDYVLNLSALKHVRSEKDPYTLMRMIDVNILNTIKTIQQSKAKGVKKYFCVSTDKAANPVNMMGASKRIMELFLTRESQNMDISTARFANVAYSDGSLLHGFKMRFEKQQPIVAPNDVRRYFVSKEESGQLCLMSTLFGDNRDIFFPRLSPDEHLLKFSDLAIDFVISKGYDPFFCNSEQEARALAYELPKQGKWPCYFSPSDTTGEKDFEEFFTNGEMLDLERFQHIGIVKSKIDFNENVLEMFLDRVNEMKNSGKWKREEIVNLFQSILPEFIHLEKGKFLDSKM